MQDYIFLGLKQIPFFAVLPDASLQTLAVNAKLVKFRKNALVISEGDDTKSLYLLLSGRVRVFTSYTEGKEVTLLTQVKALILVS